LRRATAKALAQWFAACVQQQRGKRSGAQSLARKCIPALEVAQAQGLAVLYGHSLGEILTAARNMAASAQS
jgi:hypothetical protein